MVFLFFDLRISFIFEYKTNGFLFGSRYSSSKIHHLFNGCSFNEISILTIRKKKRRNFNISLKFTNKGVGRLRYSIIY